MGDKCKTVLERSAVKQKFFLFFFYRFSAKTTNREYKTVRRKRGENDDRGSGEYKMEI